MATTHNYKVGQNYIVAIASIYANLAWNSRGDAKASSSGDEGSYEGLRDSIRLNGQQAPIVVRPADPKDPKQKGKEFQLVAGFRRFQALMDLHHGDSDAEGEASKPQLVKGLKTGEVRVEFQNLNEREARDWNIAENTARDSLSPPDLAFGIGEAVKTDPTLKTQEEIATRYGIGQAYAGRLLKIAKVKPQVFNHWRGSLPMARISVESMKVIADLDTKDEQQEAYDLAVKAMSDDPKKSGPKGWIPGSVEAAKELGTNMGYSKHDGTLNLSPSFFKLETLSRFVKIKTSGKGAASENEQQNILSAFEDAYELAAKSGSPKPEAPLTDEEKKAKKEAAKAAKKAEEAKGNGKAAGAQN